MSNKQYCRFLAGYCLLPIKKETDDYFICFRCMKTLYPFVFVGSGSQFDFSG